MDKIKHGLPRLITLVLLCLMLCVTGFALGMALYEVRENTFQTGSIEIDLNGGQPVISEEEFLFEPGMTVEKSFYIQNNGTWDVYYTLYFSQVSGSLGNMLDVTILDDQSQTLLSGKLASLTDWRTTAMEQALAVQERQDLTIRFHLPQEAGNDWQSSRLRFQLSVRAVQTKNNPDKEFE